MPVTTYSGGWKVKMQLCAAKLINADLLMLDEVSASVPHTHTHAPLRMTTS
jgi:ABC-type polysaccharide/polyol phosphate transport system ATPase subunit